MSTITWQKQNYDLAAMSDQELNDLLDWITNAAADQVCYAENWTIPQWQQRRGAYDRFLAECRGHVDALEKALEYPQVVPAPEPATEQEAIIAYAQANRARLSNILLDELLKGEGITLFDLDTKHGKTNKLGQAWEMLLSGNWQFAEGLDKPFKVLSQSGTGEVYHVHVEAGRGKGRQCDCPNDSYGKGPCKHFLMVVLAVMAYGKMEAGRAAA